MRTTTHSLILITLAYLRAPLVEAIEPPAANDLLARYTRALDAARSFVSKAEIATEADLHFEAGFDPKYIGREAVNTRGLRSYATVEWRSDGTRVRKEQYSWGALDHLGSTVYDRAQPSYCFLNWNGKDFYLHTSVANHPAKRGVVQLGVSGEYDLRKALNRGNAESCLMGYYAIQDERLDRLLRRARTLSVSHRPENVGGTDCHVLNAELTNGTCSLWLDPHHGYQAARAHLRIMKLGPGRDRITRISKLETVRFVEISGVWVPMEADTSNEVVFFCNGKNGSTRERIHCRRTEFMVNPDHEALGSFADPFKSDPHLLERTTVHKVGDPGEYVWQDGKIVLRERRSPAGPKTRMGPSGPPR